MKIIARDRKGVEHVLEGTEGWTVMEALRDAGLPITAECGGACACATCHEPGAPMMQEGRPPLAWGTPLHLDTPDDTVRIIMHGLAPPAGGLLRATRQGRLLPDGSPDDLIRGSSRDPSLFDTGADLDDGDPPDGAVEAEDEPALAGEAAS